MLLPNLIKAFANLLAAGSVWLKNWSEVNGRAGGNPQVGKYLGIYFAFGFGSSALVVIQTLILWIFCSIEVSEAACQKSCCLIAHGLDKPDFPYWGLCIFVCKLTYKPASAVGIPQVTRKDGFCHLQKSNELFRNNTRKYIHHLIWFARFANCLGWSYPESFLKVSAVCNHPAVSSRWRGQEK
jgi:hypothetical protein